MAYFHTSDQVYAAIGKLFSDLLASGGLGVSLRATNSTVRFSISDPRAQITAVMAEGGGVAFGPSSSTPGLLVELSADIAHELFLGRRNLWLEASTGGVAISGTDQAIGALWPTIEFVAPSRYVQILDAIGRPDLIVSERA